MKRGAIVFLGLVIGVAALWLSLRTVSLPLLRDILQHVKPLPLVYAFAFIIGHVLVKAFRWSYLFSNQTAVPWYRLLPAVAAGSFGNLIIPHSGEVLRSMMVRRSAGIPGALALGTIGAERFYDFIAVLLLLAATLPFAAELPQLFLQLSIIAAIICFLMVIGAIFLPSLVGISKFANKDASSSAATSISVRLQTALQNLVRGLSIIREHERLLQILSISLLQWVLMAACIFYCLVAVEIPVDFTAALYILFLSIAGLTLPTAPGYFGTLQLCFTLALAPFGISATASVAASILYNVVVIVFVTIAGVIALIAFNRSATRA